MKIWSILENVNAGVVSDIVENNNNSNFSAPLPLIEEYRLDLWFVFILGFLMGIFVYWIFSTIKIIRNRQKKDKDKRDKESNNFEQHNQEGE